MAVSLSTFNSNQVRRFTLKVILFLCVLWLADFAIGHIIDFFFKKTLYGENWPKENWVLSRQYDVVILGSSRAFRHYVPSILTDKISYSVFNAGANGQYMLYAYALEQLILDKYKPKIIVLDLLPSYITKADGVDQETERLSSLLPYANNREVRWLLTRNSLLDRLKLVSVLYRYNSRLLNIADNYFNSAKQFDNGYVSVGKTKFRTVNQFSDDLLHDQQVQFDDFKIELLKKFISSAKARNIKVIMSFSPTVEPLSAKCRQILAYYDRLFTEMQVPFIKVLTEDFPQFTNSQMFMDYIHMNDLGANAFTPIFADKLHSLLQETNLLGNLDADETSAPRGASQQAHSANTHHRNL